MTLGHVPVAHGDLGRLELLPLGQLAGVKVGDDAAVRQDGLFLEVADEAMAGPWRDQIGEEHAVEEDALGAQDHEAHEPAGFGHLEKGQEVHALVVRLF